MYYLILFHSALRWLLLFALSWAVFIAWKGRTSRQPFQNKDRIAVSAASILSHIQLILGFALYYWSPLAQGFWAQHTEGWNDAKFFAMVHFGLMSIAIVLITIGSALAKRDSEDHQKFNSVFLYYSIALLIILVAIPWPFSPLAQRPYFRGL